MADYGKSFAQGHLEHGDYEAAIGAATKAIAAEDDNPENYFDRAQALTLAGRAVEALPDYEKTRELEETADIVDRDVLDDEYFQALLSVARAEPTEAGVTRLARYAHVFPQGRHLVDMADWQKRLRGELKSEFVKRSL